MKKTLLLFLLVSSSISYPGNILSGRKRRKQEKKRQLDTVIFNLSRGLERTQEKAKPELYHIIIANYCHQRITIKSEGNKAVHIKPFAQEFVPISDDNDLVIINTKPYRNKPVAGYAFRIKNSQIHYKVHIFKNDNAKYDAYYEIYARNFHER